MADVELVIKISEEKYKKISNSNPSYADDFSIYYAVKNGTPLPKGHGRLIDVNTIQSMARKKAEDCFPEGRYDYGYRKALFEFAKDLDDVPTIIEADKKESEE